jgi:phosphatidylinositol-3-phosphatase
MKKIVFLSVFCLVLASCSPASSITGPAQPVPVAFTAATATQPPVATQPLVATQAPTVVATTTSTATPQATVADIVPNFDHIVMILLENEYYQDVIGNVELPKFNALGQQNVLLSNYSAIAHPSLPNYLALVSGSTQNVTSDCMDCFFDRPNLADEIEASGRTWKSYEEGMPAPCFLGDAGAYAQWTNPLIYFDSIRKDKTRCDRSIVPLSQLTTDLAANQLPNFSWIAPNLCDSGHSCNAAKADGWVSAMVAKLEASPALGQKSLIIITFDEGVERNTSGMNANTRGQIATVLISPLARQGFKDTTAYSHYSLLETILTAWNLPALGIMAQEPIQPIVDPWNTQLGQ